MWGIMMKKLALFGLMIVFLVGIAQAITLAAIGDKSVNENATLSFSLESSGASGAVTYTMNPAIGTLDSSTGAFTYTPDHDVSTADVNTVQTITFTATDSVDSASQIVHITVNDVFINRLEFKDIDVKVGSKSDNNIADKSDGYTIGEDATPEDHIKFNIDIENTFNEDVKIENVFVTITIESIDDGDDLDEESSEEDIRDGSSKSYTLNFDVPLKVDEDDYNVIIEAEGDDENGDNHYIKKEFLLTVNKDSHDIRVWKAEFENPVLSCSLNTNLDILALNLGSDEENEVKVTATSSALGLNFEKFDDGDIDLGTGTDEDAELDVSVPIDASKLKIGSYPVEVRVYRDTDRLEDTKTVTLLVEKCVEETAAPSTPSTGTGSTGTSTGNGVEVVVKPTAPETSTPQFPVVAQVETESLFSNSYTLILSIAAIVLIILIIAIIVVMARNK